MSGSLHSKDLLTSSSTRYASVHMKLELRVHQYSYLYQDHSCYLVTPDKCDLTCNRKRKGYTNMQDFTFRDIKLKIKAISLTTATIYQCRTDVEHNPQVNECSDKV